MKCPTCETESNFVCFQKHHKLSQSYRKHYGKLVDDPRNIQLACWCCHPGHRSPLLVKWDEIQFCENLDITPRTKIAKETWIRKYGSLVKLSTLKSLQNLRQQSTLPQIDIKP